MDIIPDKDTVARYCPKKSVSPSGNRISGAAFKLRPRDNGKLSTNWTEYIESKLNHEPIQYLREHFEKIMAETSQAKIGTLNVKKTIDYVAQESSINRKLSIYHNGNINSDNPSHSVIEGAKLDEMETFDLIADTVSNIYSF